MGGKTTTHAMIDRIMKKKKLLLLLRLFFLNSSQRFYVVVPSFFFFFFFPLALRGHGSRSASRAWRGQSHELVGSSTLQETGNPERSETKQKRRERTEPPLSRIRSCKTRLRRSARFARESRSPALTVRDANL